MKASATDEAIALLLFEWAVSKYRVGKYRALAVATLLQRRQAEILEEVRPQSFAISMDILHTVLHTFFGTDRENLFNIKELCVQFFRPK